jgi:L-ascorbate metabolism protein UlaG (beta-lactamase superfamily)
VVLITHNHYDHLDLPTLQRIGPGRGTSCRWGLGALLKA